MLSKGPQYLLGGEILLVWWFFSWLHLNLISWIWWPITVTDFNLSPKELERLTKLVHSFDNFFYLASFVDFVFSFSPKKKKKKIYEKKLNKKVIKKRIDDHHFKYFTRHSPRSTDCFDWDRHDKITRNLKVMCGTIRQYMWRLKLNHSGLCLFMIAYICETILIDLSWWFNLMWYSHFS